MTVGPWFLTHWTGGHVPPSRPLLTLLLLVVVVYTLWSTSSTLVAAINQHQKLAAYYPGAEGEKARGVFRDSLVTNVIEIAERLPNLNLCQDPRLAEIAAAMGDKLTYYSAEELRNDDNAREATKKAAEAILAAIGAAIAKL